MKKYVYIIVMSVMIIGFNGCYDDEGNYEYQELNTIEIADIEEEYVIEQFETFSITPDIAQSLLDDESNLEYLWHMYPFDRKNESDTLSFERNLNVPVKSVPGHYTAILKVTDTNTGVFYKRQFKVSVINSYSNGLMILSSINNKANLAFLNAADKLYQDVYFSVNGDYAGENPVAVNYVKNRYNQDVLIMCQDERGGVLTDGISFSNSGEYKDLFWIAPESPQPSFYYNFGGMGDDAIMDNGSLYTRGFIMMPPIKFEAPQTLNTDLAPALFYFDSSSSAIYDNNGEKFMMKGYWTTGEVIDMPDEIFNPANLGMQMLCGAKGFKGDGYGLFFDDETSTYWALSFGGSGSSVLPLTKVDVTSSTEIAQATSYVISSLSPQIFYAVDNKLYCLDALNNVTKLVYSFDAEVTIDHIELEKDADDRVMYIGTSAPAASDKIGSLHLMEVALNGSVTLSKSYENIAGKIVDFHFKVVQ